MSATEYVESLQASGRFTFTTEDAIRALGTSPVAVRAALRRLKRRGQIASPYRGFHVIVPPAYRRLGCLPADLFIPELMAHLHEPYYVGLLTAAKYHGAGHQVPMVFQVVVPVSRRGLQCGEVSIEFMARRDMRATPVVERNTDAGIIRIATPEATALEVVGYPEHCGYLSNTATVLAELAESIDGGQLAVEAARAPVAWVQRLGYLLSLVGADDLAASIEPAVAEGNTFTVALAPWKKMAGAPRDRRWNVAINTEVEPDL